MNKEKKSMIKLIPLIYSKLTLNISNLVLKLIISLRNFDNKRYYSIFINTTKQINNRE